MKGMNIAIFFDAITDQSVGSLVSTLRFADLLKKKGHKIIFIAAKYPNRPAIDTFRGYRVYRFRSFLAPKTEGHFYISFPTVNEIKRVFIKEKINLLHFMMATPAAISCVKAAEQLGIKIVAHSHTQPENILLNFPKIFQGKKVNEWTYKFMIWLYKKADVILCPSKFAEKMLKRYDSTLKTWVVSNGVDFSKFKKTNIGPFIKKYHLSRNRLRLLFVGRLHPEKNIKTLVRAMPQIVKKFKNVELIVIGMGYQQEIMEKIAKRLKVSENVKFLGRVKDDELLMAYNACDIFVLPSFAELEGMVVLEAMACGKPILIANSKDSASVDFVKNNGFLFSPRNPLDLAEKALRLLENDRLRLKMARNSYKESRDYDINKSAEFIDKIYHSI